MSFRTWSGRLALIPLAVYGIGIPLRLLLMGSVTLYRDGLLPFEVMGLFVSLAVAIWGSL